MLTLPVYVKSCALLIISQFIQSWRVLVDEVTGSQLFDCLFFILLSNNTTAWALIVHGGNEKIIKNNCSINNVGRKEQNTFLRKLESSF